jgi:hypothetical protein
MGCCGDKRKDEKEKTRVVYLGRKPFQTFGSVTGNRYYFHAIGATALVDNRDLARVLVVKNVSLSGST